MHSSTITRFPRVGRFVASGLSLAILLGGQLAVGETPPEPEKPDLVELTEAGVALEARDTLLGSGWQEGDDVAFAVLGDASGLTVLRAAASEGYAWGALATLPTNASIETDLWISNSCVTSDGKHMAVVYGPRSLTNDDGLFGQGAHAAVVDLVDGSVKDLGYGYTIAYFNPGCGSGNTFAITRYAPESNDTLVAAVDASGAVISKVEIEGLATSAVSSADGTVFASTAKGIVQVKPDQKPSTVVSTKFLTYDLSLDEQGRLAYVTLGEKEDASVALISLDGQTKPQAIATGAVTDLGVRSGGGGFFVTGNGVTAAIDDVAGVQLVAANPSDIVSSTGQLVIEAVMPAGMARADDAENLSTKMPRISARASASATDILFVLNSIAPTAEVLEAREIRRRVDAGPSTNRLIRSGDPNDPVEDERSCAVPRNDPNNQAYQPKPRQVEWAVDRAVKGQLTESRPANWRGLGMPTYTPQGYFPRTTLVGGGTIPPQIVLGVLMQESNMWQASRFTTPGNTGNPLTGDYYDNRGASSIWDINFVDADCGYGVGQITDGMRLSGQERPGDVAALPYDKQRAIALDYEANVAMTVRMLGQKWNEIANAGMQINNGNPARIENWFFAVWIYNTGFHPYTTSSAPWGVGWANNPINPVYPASRQPFLETSAADAASPQDWPYPEKVMGWAAWGTSLVETQWADASSRTYETKWISSFTTAWWTNAAERTKVKPPRAKFCSLTVNDCNPSSSSPCLLSSDECWWNVSATWKTSCNSYCGNGNERFDSTYATEASSMSSSLPALTLQSSYVADCDPPPTGVVVVDDTTHGNARNSGECTQQTTAGSFEFTFTSPDSNGSYPAKVDLHQQGGGFNGHFYFAHMQGNSGMASYPGERATVTGTWNRGANMSGKWTRVWVHVPDYAAWSQQAAYTIHFGDGSSETRYLPQRRYDNAWVSLGVFEMKGTPSVTLSNVLTRDLDPTVAQFVGLSLAGEDDVAWDSVGFQELSAKPDEFIVALGDSFSSGEGAGSYEPWSDNNGTVLDARNGCHQSSDAWVRKAVLPGYVDSIGDQAQSSTAPIDFHFLACSGGESENLLPYYTAGVGKPKNGEGQNGQNGQWSTVSQLDAGYLNDDTTLVTLSIGGNDVRFAPIVQGCIIAWFTVFGGDCSAMVLDGDTTDVVTASADRLANALPDSLGTVLAEIQSRAPNARIALMGYPSLFESGSACVLIAEDNMPWLNQLSDDLNTALADAAALADPTSGPDVFFVDPRSYFSGHNLCTSTSGINGLVTSLTPGEAGLFHDLSFDANGSIVSQQSVHPNGLGTDYYAQALEDALALHP